MSNNKNPKIEKVKYVCKACSGSGVIQNDSGDKAITCPQCEGSGRYNPYE